MKIILFFLCGALFLNCGHNKQTIQLSLDKEWSQELFLPADSNSQMISDIDRMAFSAWTKTYVGRVITLTGQMLVLQIESEKSSDKYSIVLRDKVSQKLDIDIVWNFVATEIPNSSPFRQKFSIDGKIGDENVTCRGQLAKATLSRTLSGYSSSPTIILELHNSELID